MIARMSAPLSPAVLADLPACPESVLSAQDRDRLPAGTPAPPWPTRVEAVVWWHRATPDAVLALPPGLHDQVGPRLTVGACLRYLDTPVGPYEEVLAVPVLLRSRGLRVSIPFIAVDSIASVHGGRAHWGLPKALAAFTRDGDAVEAVGEGWRVAAAPRALGPRLPAYGRFAGTQLPGGVERTARSSTRGTARPARVAVQVSSDRAGQPGSIAGWLRPGRHAGLLVRARLHVGAA